MKICLVGKFPPIEGGVSASTFWLAFGLAKKGHQVFVVTNAMEVEEEYRIHLDRSDLAFRESVFPETGGFVRVYDTEPPTSRTTHIPAHNPFVTKLAAIATQVVREQGCEAIFAHYFEPYGMAAYLASIWTGVPFIVRHAGSDIDRLMRVPQLSTAYKEMLRRADMLVTSGRLVDRFLGMGLGPEQIFTAEGFSPPPAFFHPEAPPLDLRRLPTRLAPTAGGSPVALDTAKPTIGIYGKVGFYKGSYDLVRALAILRRQGLDFNFVAMTQGSSYPAFERVVRESGMDDRTWVFPFQPNWQVPSFIRACTAVCFLERDFPIKIHTPTIAIEILKAGGCLVLSREIADKQAMRQEFADGGNVVLVEDPKQHEQLAACLRPLIENPARAREIARAGARLVDNPQGYDRFVDSWEDLIFRLAGRPSSAASLAEKTRRQLDEAGGIVLAEHLAPDLGWTRRLLGERFAAELELFNRHKAAGQDFRAPREIADAFGEHLAERRASGELELDDTAATICFRFDQERRAAWRDDDISRRVIAFGATDQLLDGPVAAPEARSLKPLRSAHAKVVPFPRDPLPFFRTGAEESDPAGSTAAETFVLFHRTPNLMAGELKIAPQTARLLELCDGTRTVDDILAALAPKQQAVLAALQTLYDQRILVFRT